MEYLSSEFLLNLLILTIVFYLVYKAMFKYLNNKKLAFVIGICAAGITIFYTRYNQELFTYTNLGYTGFAILILLPTIILFHLIYKSNFTGTIRKISWIVYILIVLYLLHNSSFAISPDITKITTIIIIATILLVLLDKIIKENIDLKKNFRGI